MPIKVACRCGKTITAPDEYAGRTGKCKACGTALAIPAASDESIVALADAHRSTPKRDADFPVATPDRTDPDEILYSASPAMFRNRPILFVFLMFAGLIFAMVGLSPPPKNAPDPWYMRLLFATAIPYVFLVWWLKCRYTRLAVTRKKISVKRGFLSRSLNEVRVTDVRNVRVEQGAFQRLFGVGKVGVSTAGQSDVEIEVSGIPHPDQVRRIIDELRG